MYLSLLLSGCLQLAFGKGKFAFPNLKRHSFELAKAALAQHASSHGDP